MKFMNRDDNALTLVSDKPDKMVFEYQSRKYAILFGAVAISLIYTVWRFGEEIKNVHLYIYWFSYFLAGAFCFGSISTLLTKCSLELNMLRKQVRYSLSSLLGKTKWERNFDDFKEIKIYRPLTGLAGRAGHAVFLKILLVTNNAEEIPLGTGMLGVYGKEKAREFADKISKSISLSIIDESSVE